MLYGIIVVFRCDCTTHCLCVSLPTFMSIHVLQNSQTLKDFLGYAESEVRSLATLYSGVVMTSLILFSTRIVLHWLLDMNTNMLNLMHLLGKKC